MLAEVLVETFLGLFKLAGVQKNLAQIINAPSSFGVLGETLEECGELLGGQFPLFLGVVPGGNRVLVLRLARLGGVA